MTDVDEKLFHCEKCQYTTDKKCNMMRHLKTPKHLEIITTEKQLACCDCGKHYKNKSSLCKHAKKCGSKITKANKIELTPKLAKNEILLEFIKQSQEMQNFLIKQNEEYKQNMHQQNEEHKRQIIELTKNQMVLTNSHNTTNNNTTNNTTNNNQQFNLQFFLNETCKDAINIMDFVESLKLQVSDLEETGKLGYIDGITRIFVNGLKELDLHKRPIHCTDIKRETVYVKDHDAWEKENSEKSKLKTAVNKISQLNLKQLKKWQEENPEYEDLSSKQNDEFIHLSTQAIGSYTQEDREKNTNKILKNVLKEVVLDKN